MKQKYLTKLRAYLAIGTVSLLSGLSTANADPAGYFAGDYVFFGYDSSVEEMYYGAVKMTVNQGHFLSIEIDNYQPGFPTYYGYINEVDKKTLKITYKNVGKQEHTAICTYKNEVGNYAELNCVGSLIGNVGGDGKFVIKSSLR